TPNGLKSRAWFQFGLVPGYTALTESVFAGLGTEVVPMQAAVSGLVSNQLYHARLVVSNAAGFAFGPEQLFVSSANVLGWRNNFPGQAQFPGNKGRVTGVAAGSSHSVLLRDDGSVEAWGDAAYAQTSVPPDLNNIVAVSARNLQTLALASNGTV